MSFSMAILEALACRLPALVTTACHFPELADEAAELYEEGRHLVEDI